MKKFILIAILGLSFAKAESLNFCSMPYDNSAGVEFFRYCANNKVIALIKLTTYSNEWNMGTINLGLPCRCYKDPDATRGFSGKLVK